MKFLIVTHVTHFISDNKYWAYGPYVREMNLWEKYVEEVIIIAPLLHLDPKSIDLPYVSKNIKFIAVPSFNLVGSINKFRTLVKLPIICYRLYLAMRRADHIHLRCPSNMGVVGCMAQMIFPHKKKTAKYAGNWDWSSKQPWSYRIQQRILKNTFLTRNMQVMVYGDWNETKNIKPFFTASYSESEILNTPARSLLNQNTVKLIFVGGLNEGKRPMLSLKVAKLLKEDKIPVEINFYGEGAERDVMESFILNNNMAEFAFLNGNAGPDVIKEAFQQSHFLIFISKSEGWPKVVAESMFWGCLPLTSAVSCVPEMIGNGTRGDLVDADAQVIAEKIKNYIRTPEIYNLKCEEAMLWSRQFTLERFEKELKILLSE